MRLADELAEPQDPPSLIQPGPDTKFGNPPLGVTLRRFFSRHVASLRFASLFFDFFRVGLRFFAIFEILALKTLGSGGHFLINLGC